MFFLLLILLISLSKSYNLNPIINLNNKNVIIHLEKFDEKYNLLHIGITFSNYYKDLRFDYRAFNDDKSCITTNINRRDLKLIFPDLYIPNNYITDTIDIYREYTEILDNDIDNKYSKNIFWGITNKTFQEIVEYEKTLNKKYKLGFYDCRHYVNQFTEWSLNKPTPIWKLYELWDKY